MLTLVVSNRVKHCQRKVVDHSRRMRPEPGYWWECRKCGEEIPAIAVYATREAKPWTFHQARAHGVTYLCGSVRRRRESSRKKAVSA